MALPLQLWQGTKQHSRVCSNDNGTSFERCNIPLPNTDFFLYKGQRITARSYLLVEFHTVNMYFKSSKIYLKQQVAGGLFISERKSYLCPWPEAGTFTCPYCLDSFIRYSSKKSLSFCVIKTFLTLFSITIITPIALFVTYAISGGLVPLITTAFFRD